jgi:hypothetical protein
LGSAGSKVGGWERARIEIGPAIGHAARVLKQAST